MNNQITRPIAQLLRFRCIGFAVPQANRMIISTVVGAILAGTGIGTWAGGRVSVSPQPVLAQTDTSSLFWPAARQLVQGQMDLLERMEQAFNSADYNRMRAIRAEFILHETAVDRFLRSQYRLPSLLCGRDGVNQGDTGNLTAEQAQTYCALYASTQALVPIRLWIAERLLMMTTLSDIRPLPLVTGEWVRDPATGVRTWQRGDLSVPGQPRFAPAPDLPPPTTVVVGRPTKQPIANYDPPFQPAIAPPQPATAQMEAAKTRLAQVRATFPAETQFVDARRRTEAAEQLTYGLSPQESQIYSQFARLPNSGVARILPGETYRVPVNTLRNRLATPILERYPFAALADPRSPQFPVPANLQNRLAPPELERYPFVPLPRRTNQFTPRLAIQLEDSQFQMVQQSGFDYGFMADLGQVPLEAVKPDLSNVSLPSAVRQFFLTYRPPTELAALQADQRRFMAGKMDAAWNLDKPLVMAAPVALNHTYVVRSLQFQMPDVITFNRRVVGRDRRNLEALLQMQSSDLLVAFRPINRRFDGTYVVQWRVLSQFPNPQIVDLSKYVQQ